MNALWYSLPLMGAFLALFFLPMGAILLWKKRQDSRRRSPLNQMLLRGPGESLRNELDDKLGEMLILWIMFPTMPLLFYAFHLSQSYLGGVQESDFRIVLSVLAGVVFSGYLLFKIIALVKRINKLRLGYEGEVAVAQELNQLMREGAYVFHDVPADGFNIDHVIVWPKGVYAVETKARMKPKRNRGKEDAKVVFDGQRLRFPGWTETAPLEQATRQAKWLAQELSGAVGDTVSVKPVLALPGWYVERKGKSEVFIVSGREASNAISKWTHTPLSEDMVIRIANQLDQRCRNVTPKYFHKREQISTDAS